MSEHTSQVKGHRLESSTLFICWNIQSRLPSVHKRLNRFTFGALKNVQCNEKFGFKIGKTKLNACATVSVSLTSGFFFSYSFAPRGSRFLATLRKRATWEYLCTEY